MEAFTREMFSNVSHVSRPYGSVCAWNALRHFVALARETLSDVSLLLPTLSPDRPDPLDRQWCPSPRRSSLVTPWSSSRGRVAGCQGQCNLLVPVMRARRSWRSQDRPEWPRAEEDGPNQDVHRTVLPAQVLQPSRILARQVMGALPGPVESRQEAILLEPHQAG